MDSATLDAWLEHLKLRRGDAAVVAEAVARGPQLLAELSAATDRAAESDSISAGSVDCAAAAKEQANSRGSRGKVARMAVSGGASAIPTAPSVAAECAAAAQIPWRKCGDCRHGLVRAAACARLDRPP